VESSFENGTFKISFLILSNLILFFFRLYYGGGQKRPDAMYCKSIKNFSGKEISLVGQSNRKDIRNAVEAAQKAQPGWAKRSGL
jgi:hypothetical protein